MKKRIFLSTVLAVSLFGAMPANANITYISADTTEFAILDNDGVGFTAGNPDNISNGSGLSAAVNAITDSTISTIAHDRGFNATIQHIFANGGTQGQYDFIFSSPQDITNIYIWNYSQGASDQNNGRGIGSYEIFLDTGSGFGAVPDFVGTLDVSGNPDHLAQNIDFVGVQAGVVGVRLVGDNINQPAIPGPSGAHGVGLDEVVFRTVPEPGSFGLFTAGLALFMAARRRKEAC